MDLFPQLMLCALIVIAFAATAPQIAPLMQVYHRSSVVYKAANAEPRP